MKILGIKNFIELNENHKTYDIGHITDPNEIREKLKYISKESEKNSINFEQNKFFDCLESSHNQKSNELTRELASLDISPELLNQKDISEFLSKIYSISAKEYYSNILSDNVYVESKEKEWFDTEPGDPGYYEDVYEFSCDFESTLTDISGENLVMRTYNLSIYYSTEINDIVAYVDGYTPDGKDSIYTDNLFGNDEIPLENEIDLYCIFETMYDEHCDEAKNDYGGFDY